MNVNHNMITKLKVNKVKHLLPDNEYYYISVNNGYVFGLYKSGDDILGIGVNITKGQTNCIKITSESMHDLCTFHGINFDDNDFIELCEKELTRNNMNDK